MAKKKEVVKPSNDLVRYAQQLKVYVDKKNNLSTELKELNALMEAFNAEFVELMQDSKVSKVEVDGVGTCSISRDIYPSITDQVKLFAALRKSGAGAMIKEVIAPGTLKVYCKELLESENKLPAGVEVFPKLKVKLRKAKGGSNGEVEEE